MFAMKMRFAHPIEEWAEISGKVAAQNPTKPTLTQAFSVVPNPSNNFLKITMADINKETTYVELADLQGRILLKTKILASDSSTEIDVTHFASGIYFVKIYNNFSNDLQKILISH